MQDEADIFLFLMNVKLALPTSPKFQTMLAGSPIVQVLGFKRCMDDYEEVIAPAMTGLMDIYQLRLLSTVDPQWLTVAHRGRVAVDNNQVTLDGERLEIVSLHRSGRTEAATLASGTLLEIWQHSNGTFVGARAEDGDGARAAKAAREEADQIALQEREERLRNQALAFNASLSIPGRWMPGIIVDASGIRLEVRAHNERDREVHVLLKQAIHDGRLIRVAGDLLCQRSRRTGGERLSTQRLDEHARVTCPSCLTAAKRWQNE